MGNDDQLRGRVVVVTGSSAGVGRAAAQAFGRAGAQVALLAREPEALEEARAEIESAGARALGLAVDVADGPAVFEAAERIERELGPIDVWVNNAMLTVYAPVAEMTPEEFRRVTETTYLGFVHGTMAALKAMRPRRAGTIIQVGSSLSYRGIPLQAAYCGAKHAIRGFTDALRAELIHEGSPIALVMVQLPAVNTPQFDWARAHLAHAPRPVPPVFQPEVAALAILTAARIPSREYWLGLSTAKVIFGSMAFPGFLDRYLARRAYRAEERHRPLWPDRPDNLEAPVRGLHRTRGSFGQEARTSALLLSDLQARLAVVGLGAILYALLARPARREDRLAPGKGRR